MKKVFEEYEVLDTINSPADLRKLNSNEKKELAKELRQFILEKVSKTGGHLASNLGAIELTIAIHDVFDTPRDKVVWDVGHQTYAHKILTGRKNQFDSLRQFEGLSGFPKTCESEYDVFDTGHSSTSISAALGIARARDIEIESIKKKRMSVKQKLDNMHAADFKVIAIIGDGALTGGMALEALNDAGVSKTNLIVILNDNEMSISKNSGGMARALTSMRTRKFYRDSNKRLKSAVSKVPKFGNWIIKVVHKIKYALKKIFIKNMMFEELGFTYLGPIDGHDIDKMEAILKKAKDFEGPVLIHCKTVKGKGYKPAEENPDKFHSVGKFDIKTGLPLATKSKDYSKAFGEKLVEIAKENDKVIAITAAMTDGTGLKEFSEKYPKRFFDVEIAEQHAVTLAAGMAREGCVPVVALYSSFLQRAYDQVVHDVCMQNLHVVLCIDRAGIVGADGETHQGLFDMAFLNTIPNMTIMAPKDFNELGQMLDYAINKMNSPVAIRYPRGTEAKISFEDKKEINMGQAEFIDNNMYKKDDVENIYISGDANKNINQNNIKIKYDRIKIVGIGKTVSRAFEVAQVLYKRNKIETEIINARFVKPLDSKIIENKDNKKELIISIEDGTLKGGLYTTIIQAINDKNIQNTKVIGFGYNDKYIKQGSVDKLEEINGLDTESIYKNILKEIKVKENTKKDIKNKNIKLIK